MTRRSGSSASWPTVSYDEEWWKPNQQHHFTDFKTETGAVVIGGLHFLPIALYLRLHGLVPADYEGSLTALSGVFVFGRLYGAAMEMWVNMRHIKALLTTQIEREKREAE